MMANVVRKIEYESDSEEEDDFSAPYQSDYTSKFTKRIASFSTTKKAKMPSIVKTYDGSGDPDDHMAIFSGVADTEGWPMPIWCRMFSQTLVGPAKVWFGELEEESIDSFKDLKKKFELYFMQQRRYTKGPTDVAKIKQRENEGLREFVERWKRELLQIKGRDDTIRISGFMEAIRPPTLIAKLNARVPKTVDEMMERVGRFLDEKEASRQYMELGPSTVVKSGGGHHNWRSQTSPTWRASPGRKSFSPTSHERRFGRGRVRTSPMLNMGKPRKHVNFTELTKTPSEILATKKGKVNFVPPLPS